MREYWSARFILIAPLRLSNSDTSLYRDTHRHQRRLAQNRGQGWMKIDTCYTSRVLKEEVDAQIERWAGIDALIRPLKASL